MTKLLSCPVRPLDENPYTLFSNCETMYELNNLRFNIQFREQYAGLHSIANGTYIQLQFSSFFEPLI